MNSNSFFNNKKVLLVGSNGFVGQNIVDYLKNTNCKLYGFGRSSNVNDSLKNYYKCNINNKTRLEEIINNVKPNFIFNLAGIVTGDRDVSLYNKMLKVHCQSLFDFYEILKDKEYLDLFINFGSTEEYGDYNGVPYKETFFEKSSSPYAASKTAGVKFCYMIGKNNNFPIITVRPGVLFGKYQSKEKFTKYVFHKLIKNENLNLTKCQQTRDFIYVETFNEILFELICSQRYEYGEIYNIASGESISLKSFINIASQYINSESSINYGAIDYRENEIMYFNVSIDKVEKVLDKKIKVNLKEDIKNYVKVITGGN